MTKVLSRVMRSSAVAALLLALSPLAGCAGRQIPGTQIPDNSDTRAIVALIDAYRQAAERRDAHAVLSLVSTKYFDDSGTPDPGDDVDRATLEKRIVDDYKKLTSMRLDIAVRKIDVQDDQASAFIYYTEFYRIETKSGDVPREGSDLHRMRFIREGGMWKFLSGL